MKKCLMIALLSFLAMSAIGQNNYKSKSSAKAKCTKTAAAKSNKSKANKPASIAEVSVADKKAEAETEFRLSDLVKKYDVLYNKADSTSTMMF